MTMSIIPPKQYELTKIYSCAEKNISIILQKYYPSSISVEKTKLISNLTQISENTLLYSSYVAELIMSISNFYYFSYSLSLIFGFCK